MRTCGSRVTGAATPPLTAGATGCADRCTCRTERHAAPVPCDAKTDARRKAADAEADAEAEAEAERASECLELDDPRLEVFPHQVGGHGIGSRHEGILRLTGPIGESARNTYRKCGVCEG